MKQREYLRDLRAELKALIDSGVNNKTIRYFNGVPKIVDAKVNRSSKKN